MNEPSWQDAKRLFLSALDAGTESRGRILGDRNVDDALRAMVESMLDADIRLEESAQHGAPADPSAPRDGKAGERFGEYRIARMLGRGGMGVVYLAERERGDAVQRVALKLIRHHVFGAEELRRFHMERRLLARIEHPGIARLIDAGSVHGVPYYAMEYVEGEPLLAYCDRNGLGLEKRLRLAVEVASAVACAHRSLVVHRDVKPSNVMVDREGRPRLLDFGIAKALDPNELPAEQTGTRNRFFSPQCTAPEIVAGGPVTTACDIYALGALLYELLTGVAPLRFESQALVDVERAILYQSPSPPSERVVALETSESSAIAQQRGFATPQALGRRLRGDLDTLILRALAKEPERRYPSVDAFVEDIERHLDDRPLRARPDSLAYRIGKLMRRHRWPVALAVLGLVAVLAVVALTVVNTQRVAHERDIALIERARAERIGAFLIDTFAMADPTRTLGDQITARELLDQAMLRIESERNARDAVRTRILATMARAYLGLGRYQQAIDAGMRALDAALDDLERSQAHRLLADALNGIGDFDRAFVHASAAQDIDDSHQTRAALAPILANLGRHDEAESLYRSVVADLESDGTDIAAIASAHVQYARHLRNARRHEEAGARFRMALRLQRSTLPKTHPAIAETLAGLAAVERALGNAGQALALSEESLGILRRIYGDEHPMVGRSWGSLGNALADAERYDEAVSAMQKALELVRRYHGGESAVVAMAHYNLGRIFQTRLRDPQRAEPHFAAAVAAGEVAGPPSNLLFFRLGLAASRNALGREEEAYRTLQPTLDLLLAEGGSDTLSAAYVRSELGESLRRMARFEEALALLEPASAAFELRSETNAAAALTARERLMAARSGNSDPIEPAAPRQGE